MLHRVTALVPSRTARLIVSSALAAGILTGCASGSVHPAKLASAAQAELERGRLNGAIDKAEKAVLADPRNPAYRVLLGNAYLKAGRFESARQAYDESMELGEDSGRTALSLALADIALGMHAEAIDTLGAYRDSLDVTDYGLALTLAGQPAQGVAVLSDALRNGENTPKLRQNLALSYALHGRWRDEEVSSGVIYNYGRLIFTPPNPENYYGLYPLVLAGMIMNYGTLPPSLLSLFLPPTSLSSSLPLPPPLLSLRGEGVGG